MLKQHETSCNSRFFTQQKLNHKIIKTYPLFKYGRQPTQICETISLILTLLP
ncbi:hypothetical protein HanXRQr2_Chr09g0399891 [Helianthus annuus]|uniref:Uncharacterized protein n=1 Tax=Helianthus annuus TaxID=4232 RepID=A0A9K3N9E4_HELAN|nr:hypothetical protein HanXRQr2_Chr09g0399891 [Helianthus annuus]KAJ0894130.1 hypothetical protein HanPSC8_Chr09g0385641 [Helianthus annuus]